MTEKRFNMEYVHGNTTIWHITDCGEHIPDEKLCDLLNELNDENEKLKAQLYCDDEEGVCNICKHHYLVKDDETELGYYNSRCQKGHYECARVSLKYCDDFELEGDVE